MDWHEFEEKQSRYQSGRMSAAEAGEFEKALQEWEAALQNDPLVQRLRRRRRPEPPADLLREYHHALQQQFPAAEPSRSGVFAAIRAFLFAQGGSPAVRIAGALAVVVIGFLAGRAFLTVPQTAPVAVKGALEAAPFYLSGITLEELQKMDAFFVDAEMLLLQVANLNSEDEMIADEIAIIRAMAGLQLPRTALMKERAVRYNDLQMLHFLSRVEIVFYELANNDPDEIIESLSFLQEMLRETGILEEARALQEVYRSDAVPTAAL